MVILIGVEFSQRRSPSAICVATNPLRTIEGQKERHFEIRSLECLEAGTTFPALARRLATMEAGVRKHAPGARTAIYVNATGVGDPLVQYLNSNTQARVQPVYFTYGERRSETWAQVDLGKALLVSRLQILLHSGRMPQPEILAEELLAHKIRAESDANERSGAFPMGTQDDLVTVLGLAVQSDVPNPGVVSGALPWPPSL
ncbi:MAG: hypothetical protein K0U98_21415 [Deltaproteobacteria bacterium]|nr:hypothetical protein [Deltaproteobacteria bacterium]